jgi:hypothetical protein
MSYRPEGDYRVCDATLARSTIVAPLSGAPAEFPGVYDPARISYYTEEIWPSIAPSMVVLCLFGALLVAFLAWRLAVACCCRGRSRRARDAEWGHPTPFRASEDGSIIPQDLYDDAVYGVNSVQGKASSSRSRKGCSPGFLPGSVSVSASVGRGPSGRCASAHAHSGGSGCVQKSGSSSEITKNGITKNEITRRDQKNEHEERRQCWVQRIRDGQ